MKKKPNGVSFMLFLDSLNMKRLSSTFLLHTCKSIGRVVSPTVGYLFFSSDRLNHMKKDPNGVFFRIPSDSLNMNDTEFYFSGLIKVNIERPSLGTNPSSLRFVKHMSLDLSSDKLYQVFVTLFELVKLKRGTHQS